MPETREGNGWAESWRGDKMWRVEEPLRKAQPVGGVASLGAGRAETKSPAGEELPDSPLELLKVRGFPFPGTPCDMHRLV